MISLGLNTRKLRGTELLQAFKREHRKGAIFKGTSVSLVAMSSGSALFVLKDVSGEIKSVPGKGLFITLKQDLTGCHLNLYVQKKRPSSFLLSKQACVDHLAGQAQSWQHRDMKQKRHNFFLKDNYNVIVKAKYTHEPMQGRKQCDISVENCARLGRRHGGKALNSEIKGLFLRQLGSHDRNVSCIFKVAEVLKM